MSTAVSPGSPLSSVFHTFLRKRQLYVLQGLPGVGPTRAGRLLEAFGSVERVFTASADELGRVPGLGRKTAEEIRGVVRETRASYEAG